MKIILGVYLNPTIISKSNLKKIKRIFKALLFSEYYYCSDLKETLTVYFVVFDLFLDFVLDPFGTDKNAC